MRNALATTAKWTWIVLVVVAAGVVVSRSWDDIADTLLGLSPWLLAAGTLVTAIAKLFLAENARIAAARNDFRIGYVVAARLYNLSQLGKYLPGSIWQFVGRAAAYRHLGASYGQIRDSLLVESLWVVLGAALVGLVLTGPALYPVLRDGLSPGVVGWLAGGVLAVAAVMAVLAVRKRHVALRYLRLALPSRRAMAVQAVIWMLLGAAFWILARACGVGIDPLLATGLFAVAYAFGFLVPFAPAGLGVRDGLLTAGLLPFTGPGQALAVTVLARLVYLAVDLLMVAVQELLMLIPAVGRRMRDSGSGA